MGRRGGRPSKGVDDTEVAAVLSQSGHVPGREVAKRTRFTMTLILKGAEIAVGIFDSYAPVRGERILHSGGDVPTQPVLARLFAFAKATKITGEDFL